MLSPGRTTVRLGGYEFKVREAAKALDILEVQIHHLLRLQDRMGPIEPKPEDLKTIYRWCREHTVDVSGTGWAEWSPEERLDWLDKHLDHKKAQTLREEIVELSKLPEGIVEQIEQYYYLASGDGCECPVCQGLRRETQGTREKHDCLYGELGEEIDRIVGSVHSVSAASKDIPYWLYQIQQAMERGRSRAWDEEKKHQDSLKSSTEVLKQRGYAPQ